MRWKNKDQDIISPFPYRIQKNELHDDVPYTDILKMKIVEMFSNFDF